MKKFNKDSVKWAISTVVVIATAVAVSGAGMKWSAPVFGLLAGICGMKW